MCEQTWNLEVSFGGPLLNLPNFSPLTREVRR